MTTYTSACLGLFPGSAECTDAFAWALEQLPDGSTLRLEPGEYRFHAASAGLGDYSLSNSDILDLPGLIAAINVQCPSRWTAAAASR